MAGIKPKDKEALALLYEQPEFKALQRWSEIKRLTVAEQILQTDMSQPGSSERIAMLQGQAYAHEYMMKELKKIHKDQTKEP